MWPWRRKFLADDGPEVHAFRDDGMSGVTTYAWIQSHVYTNRWLLPLDDDYVRADFNFYGFCKIIPQYSLAMRVIRGQYICIDDGEMRAVEQAAIELYCLAHARYVLTAGGLRQLVARQRRAFYPACPRVGCGFGMIPCGVSVKMGVGDTKLFCPSCCDLYDANCQLDGAHFGPSLPGLVYQALQRDGALPEHDVTPAHVFGALWEPDAGGQVEDIFRA